MSKTYTEEQSVTIAEVRAAIEVAVQEVYDGQVAPNLIASRAIDALRKPPIHRSCPVMYDYTPNMPDAKTVKQAAIYEYFKGRDLFADDEVRTNPVVLIPETTVMEKAKERDDYLREVGQINERLAEVGYWKNVIADHRRNGLSHE